MAVVATATTSSTPVVLSSGRRLTLVFRWLIVLACVSTLLDLLVCGVARAALPVGGLEQTHLVLVVAACALSVAAATAAWLTHRRRSGLLLAATLAATAATLRL